MIELWGKYTWIMFHTLAEKIKCEYQNDIIILKDIWKQISIICCNLPCPFCTKHAVKFIKTVKINNIKHKEDIKLLLFTFHNEVNKRTNKKIFIKEELDNYSNNNTIQCFNNFYYNYNIATNHGMQFHKSLMAKHALSNFQKWFLENQQLFNK